MLSRDKIYEILFIGNSYTYYNDMPKAIFAEIMKSAGYSVNVESHTKGGGSLADALDLKNTYAENIENALKTKRYDFVVLQDNSTQTIKKPEEFVNAVTVFCDKIKANGAVGLLYSTWGRHKDSPTLAELGLTSEEMSFKIAAAYKAVGEKLGIDVANVGLAFYDIYNNTEINLYNDDKTHPSESGSFLAALTVFAKITGLDPNTLSFNYSVSEKDAECLKAAAHRAAFVTPEIPEDLKYTE